MDAGPSDDEEFEQIPWSSLVAEQTAGVDRRVYLAVGVVAVLVAAILGSRMIGGTTQPAPLALPPVEVEVPDTSRSEAMTTPSSTVGVVVSEADLMAALPTLDPTDSRLAVVFAEWFVTDYFTTDGSIETEESVAALMSLSSSPDPRELPRPPDGTYVEWARATDVAAADESSLAVRILFRTISSTSDGFVRDPVAAVSVSIVTSGDAAGVAGPPVTVPVPTLDPTRLSIDRLSISDASNGTP